MHSSNQYHLARFMLSALLLAGCAPILNPFLPTAYENRHPHRDGNAGNSFYTNIRRFSFKNR
jgi:hypothetical protein